MSGNEDASDNVASYLRAIRRIISPVSDAAAIVSLHTGWQDGDSPRKRERGSSAWRGNSDGTVYLEGGEANRDVGTRALILRSLKARDDGDFAPIHVIRTTRVALCPRPLWAPENVLHSRRRSLQSSRTGRRSRASSRRQALETFDRQVLHVVATHPQTATSQDFISAQMGVRKAGRRAGDRAIDRQPPSRPGASSRAAIHAHRPREEHP